MRPVRSEPLIIRGMPTKIPLLVHGNFFHIFNRGNNRENIFVQERNYSYFMELWWKHISPIAETWAFCLLRNHFHAAVYVKEQVTDLTGPKLKDPSKYFSNLFNAYTRSLNIAIQRTGALFERPFKRIPIDKEAYLMRLIIYIHQNPQKHSFVTDFRDWNFSSYHSIIGNAPTRLQKDKVLQFFGSREDFIRIHQEIQPLADFEDED